ncbi:Formate hydrogenlyase transcriptional activator [Labilithrix luteola]|uniref:Formate hydrogenlyase transcriptional activator n=1 Tax=Labilithrix luteola TaxID=1391654 RepID=A0A0K1Q6W7_9BACT|nr:sigma-54 dependent transcriptional regulator [Labilithrix luteola]AKV01478.1 Formate hydrogenlyase transcriptional activator [Labilithrix luteola]
MTALSTRSARHFGDVGNTGLPTESGVIRLATGQAPSPSTGETVEFDRAAVQDNDMIIAGDGLRDVLARIEQVAPTNAAVLLEGETGSGKELLARMVHARSSRARGPMLRVNCGAIPAELVDSELFGHERGSFTGATSTRLGWFERADGGTLFLDEVGELSLPAQVRLLRVLQDGTLERVGGGKSLRVDVRVITATHRNLRAMCAQGTFREDLFYRIGVFTVRIPPLRDRRDDIPALASHFAKRAGVRLTGIPLVPSASELEDLQDYRWPGNVRELAAVIERAAILGGGRKLEVRAALGDGSAPSRALETGDPSKMNSNANPVSLPSTPHASAFPTLEETMRAHIHRALVLTRGRIEGRGGAADILGLNPHTLRGKMRKLRIDWARFRTIAVVPQALDGAEQAIGVAANEDAP